ncbi:MAG: hypothetical protein KAR54_01460 [Candidatus Pacebacteria bacterium]|nr:hypothetical protein [Candidatus Paceibacterota bacterium]
MAHRDDILVEILSISFQDFNEWKEIEEFIPDSDNLQVDDTIMWKCGHNCKGTARVISNEDKKEYKYILVKVYC